MLSWAAGMLLFCWLARSPACLKSLSSSISPLYRELKPKLSVSLLRLHHTLRVWLPLFLREAGNELRITKSTELGSIHLFGRSLEWKRVSDAEELKSSLVRLVRECRAPTAYLDDLASVYRESFAARAARRGKSARAEKPWRTYMRLSRVIPQVRGREQNNLRNAVITNLVGKGAAGVKLRPSARIGLEWARLEASA